MDKKRRKNMEILKGKTKGKENKKRIFKDRPYGGTKI